MEQELEQHVAGCARAGPEGALLLNALDGSHAVTAALGQGPADEVLASIGERLVAPLRTTDKVGRWGKSELAVLLRR